MFPAPYTKGSCKQSLDLVSTAGYWPSPHKIVAPSLLYEATDAISLLSLEPFRKASRDTYAFSRVSAGHHLSFAPISSPD